MCPGREYLVDFSEVWALYPLEVDGVDSSLSDFSLLLLKRLPKFAPSGSDSFGF